MLFFKMETPPPFLLLLIFAVAKHYTIKTNKTLSSLINNHKNHDISSDNISAIKIKYHDIPIDKYSVFLTLKLE